MVHYGGGSSFSSRSVVVVSLAEALTEQQWWSWPWFQKVLALALF